MMKDNAVVKQVYSDINLSLYIVLVQVKHKNSESVKVTILSREQLPQCHIIT